MKELLGFIGHLVGLYKIIVVAAVLMQILLQMNVIPYNPMIRQIAQGLYAVTEPLLAPIRRKLPKTGNLDLSPVVLILALMFIESVALPVLIRNLG